MKIRGRIRRGFTGSGASSDIAFLLIIYFIVIAGFNGGKGFLMSLPGDSPRFIPGEDILRFELDEAGDMVYRGEKREAAFAAGEIKRALAGNPNMAVLLTIDPRSPWQGVVAFVEMAQDLHIDSFSFTIKKEGSPR
jgi:biopolymer transport protein ExbD